MYAPAHVATALAVKRKFPVASLFWLMIATQAVELLWMLLSYLGMEHQSVDANGVLHLDFLPYSHSLLTGFGSAVLVYIIMRWGFRRPTAALAVGIAMATHVALDLVQHEPDIQIAWFLNRPRLGLNLGAVPLLDFVVETAFVIVCWWYFGGDWKLLFALLFLSLTNLPMMFSDGSGRALANSRMILPTIILLQTILTIALVWLLARQRSAALGPSLKA